MGRIYNERRQLVPTAVKGEPRLLSAHIFDPTTRLNIFYEPQTHLAREATLPPAVAQRQMPTTPRVPVSGNYRPGTPIKETDLGEQIIDNTTLRGTEKQRTIAATSSGTGQPITITDEYWFSPDLSVYFIVKHNDPRTGEQIVAVTHIDRHDPSPARFDVPSGYKVVDETPPSR